MKNDEYGFEELKLIAWPVIQIVGALAFFAYIIFGPKKEISDEDFKLCVLGLLAWIAFVKK